MGSGIDIFREDVKLNNGKLYKINVILLVNKRVILPNARSCITPTSVNDAIGLNLITKVPLTNLRECADRSR